MTKLLDCLQLLSTVLISHLWTHLILYIFVFYSTLPASSFPGKIENDDPCKLILGAVPNATVSYLLYVNNRFLMCRAIQMACWYGRIWNTQNTSIKLIYESRTPTNIWIKLHLLEPNLRILCEWNVRPAESIIMRDHNVVTMKFELYFDYSSDFLTHRSMVRNYVK